ETRIWIVLVATHGIPRPPYDAYSAKPCCRSTVAQLRQPAILRLHLMSTSPESGLTLMANLGRGTPSVCRRLWTVGLYSPLAMKFTSSWEWGEWGRFIKRGIATWTAS